MSLRFRQEADTLSRLIEADELLIGQSELLRTLVDGHPAEALIAASDELQAGLSAIAATLSQRQSILLARTA